MKRDVLFLQDSYIKSMKIVICIIICSMLFILSSCGGKGSEQRPFNGTFVTSSGIKFELKEDSTTFIQFDDSLNFEGKWSIRYSDDSTAFANIEFAGKSDYYYLKGGKLYHSEREMLGDKMGATVEYLEE